MRIICTNKSNDFIHRLKRNIDKCRTLKPLKNKEIRTQNKKRENKFSLQKINILQINIFTQKRHFAYFRIQNYLFPQAPFPYRFHLSFQFLFQQQQL